MSAKDGVYPTSGSQDPKTRWESFELLRVGDVAEILKGGGGKLTPPGGDPGEMRKQEPTG
jgi:hypothetical protein